MKYIKLYERYRHIKHSLLLERSIEVGDNLSKKLDSINSDLYRKLKKFLDSDDIRDVEVTKIDFDDDDDKVFTLTDERGSERKFKFGKLLKYLGYNDEVKGYEIEDFISNFRKSDTTDLELRKGKDILKSYLCDNYDREKGYGNLHSSCMRHKHAQDYLEIYTKNPDQVSCLTLINPDNNKVRGRALIWKMDNGEYLMDKIYTINNEYNSIFNKYASDNNFTKYPSDITLKNGGEFDFYPYMDTFVFYTPDGSKLSTKDGDLHLTAIDGSSDDLVWSDLMGEEIERSESVFSDRLGDYIYRYNAVEIYNGFGEPLSYYPYNYFDNDVVEVSFTSDKYSDYEGVYVHIDDVLSLEANYDKYVLKDDDDIYSDYIYGVHIKLDKGNYFDALDYPEYFSIKLTWGDNLEYFPLNKCCYLYHDGEFEIALIDDIDDEDLIEFTMDHNIPETVMIPEEFVTSDLINVDAPIYVDILTNKFKLKTDKTEEIHSNLYLTSDSSLNIKYKCKKTKNGYRIFPPMADIFNEYEYNKWLDWSKGSKDKTTNYFIESFNKGEYLESNILRVIGDKNSYVFDEFNDPSKITHKNYGGGELSNLIDFINSNNSESKSELFSIPDVQINSLWKYASWLSFYKSDGHKIFPYIYSSKEDKYLVCRAEDSKYRLYGANEIMNLIRYNNI